ncbi:hypothetical protein RDB90_004472 [Salmonella enterica]|nr:hypothetical protein [Salmonella enterica]
MPKYIPGTTTEHFGEDVVFSHQLTEKSLENIIGAHDFHAREAEWLLAWGAKELDANMIVRGHVHRAAAAVLMGVIYQLDPRSPGQEALVGRRDKTQEDRDYNAEEYLKNPAPDFSLVVVKPKG